MALRFLLVLCCFVLFVDAAFIVSQPTRVLHSVVKKSSVSPLLIQWSTNSPLYQAQDTVQIDLYANSTVLIASIASVANVGQYQWSPSASLPSADGYYLNLTHVADGVSAQSETFMLVPESTAISISRPNVLDQFRLSSTEQIIWTSTGVPRDATLVIKAIPQAGSVAASSFSSWTLSSGIVNTGSFNWSIPASFVASRYQIYIAWNSTVISSYSNYFQVSASGTVDYTQTMIIAIAAGFGSLLVLFVLYMYSRWKSKKLTKQRLQRIKEIRVRELTASPRNSLNHARIDSVVVSSPRMSKANVSRPSVELFIPNKSPRGSLLPSEREYGRGSVSAVPSPRHVVNSTRRDIDNKNFLSRNSLSAGIDSATYSSLIPHSPLASPRLSAHAMTVPGTRSSLIQPVSPSPLAVRKMSQLDRGLDIVDY